VLNRTQTQMITFKHSIFLKLLPVLMCQCSVRCLCSCIIAINYDFIHYVEE
jgi:hypothetical protein